MPASCAVLAETVEGSNVGVGDLTKHVRQVEHVWRTALNASGRFRVGVHLERKGWRSGRSGRSGLRGLGERRASLGEWMMIRVRRFIAYGGSQSGLVLCLFGPANQLISAALRSCD